MQGIASGATTRKSQFKNWPKIHPKVVIPLNVYSIIAMHWLGMLAWKKCLRLWIRVLKSYFWARDKRPLFGESAHFWVLLSQPNRTTFLFFSITPRFWSPGQIPKYCECTWQTFNQTTLPDIPFFMILVQRCLTPSPICRFEDGFPGDGWVWSATPPLCSH